MDKKVQAWKLLSQGMLRKDIAKQLGISERTLRRWLNEGKEPRGQVNFTLLPAISTEEPDIERPAVNNSQERKLEPQKQYCLDLQNFRNEVLEDANTLSKISELGLSKLLEVLQRLPTSEINSPRTLEILFRISSQAVSLYSELKSDIFGVDKLLNAIQDKTKN